MPQIVEPQISALIVNRSYARALALMVDLARMFAADGQTQEAADLLAWVLIQPDTDADTHQRAEEQWDDLVAGICPRVLHDAQFFASRATWDDIADYLLA